ncbi:hypothetical protein M0805_005251 [Coniferiporia weirii]|nr:hypothetical protein M0805_005251 [Coniferiporia weirii]
MPICTTCTQKLFYLYTVYQSANNTRLEQCPKCLNFADPYVEHDTLTLLLDLILLKRGVFRHLLFNRGYEPRRASRSSSPEKREDEKQRLQRLRAQRERGRWRSIFQLGIVLVFIDAFIRWSHLSPSDSAIGGSPTIWTQAHIEPFLRIFAGCLIETFAFHTGITLTSAAALKLIGLWDSARRKPSPSAPPKSGVLDELRISHIPLTILYSSLTKLFLLLLLALWKPSSVPSGRTSPASSGEGGLLEGLLAHEVTQKALEILDDDKLDREWVVRNVLGGMAAGFGLRVVLDIHPWFTTMVILIGWAVKTFVAGLVSAWVNKGGSAGDVFLAYSIP